MKQVLKDEAGQVIGWVGKCAHCHKKFQTSSRRQKFCCPECAKKHQVQLKETRVRYEKVKDFERLRVRSHGLAVDIVKLLITTGHRDNCCQRCGVPFDAQHPMVIHHKNLNFLDNNPLNLMSVCNKCHALEHSELEKRLNEEGVLLEEYYDDGIKPFLNVLNKNCGSKHYK